MRKIIILGLSSMLAFSSFKEKNETTLTLEIKNFDPDLLIIWDAFGTTNWRDNLKNEGGKNCKSSADRAGRVRSSVSHNPPRRYISLPPLLR
ncbi:MAG: hypothetical protein ACO25B_12060 [Chitinophagaceae bacterium]